MHYILIKKLIIFFAKYPKIFGAKKLKKIFQISKGDKLNQKKMK